MKREIAGLYAAIIERGNHAGGFVCSDLAEAGVALHAATIKFCHPFLVEQYQEQDAERQIAV